MPEPLRPRSRNSSRAAVPALWVGLGLMALSLVWWFVYYAHHLSPFAQLGLKLSCLVGTSPDCTLLQDGIGPIRIPAYRPYLWWAGVVAFLVGQIQRLTTPLR